MSLMTPWDAMVGEMIRRRMLLQQADPFVYPMEPIGLRATDADLAGAAARLGHPLDDQHADLLRRINGWPEAFAGATLLSTDDLGAGPLWSEAQETLDVFYEDGDTEGWPSRETIYPIHLGEAEVFVIDMSAPTTDGGHPVHWLADVQRATWTNVYQFWLAGFALLEQTTEIATRRRQAESGS